MFAKYLTLEGSRGQALKHLEQVWDALDQLNGNHVSVLIVAEGPPEPRSDISWSGKSLHIAGGKNNQYVCTAFLRDDGAATYARNPSIPYSTKGEIWIQRGQLESFYPHQVLGYDLIRAALGDFVTRGELTDKIIWENLKSDVDLWKPLSK